MQRLKTAIARNLRVPSTGPVGWLVKHMLQRKNEVVEIQAAKLLNIQPHHQVLEVGFGPGLGLKEALTFIDTDGPGKVYGLDLSPQMLDVATKRLQPHIASGKLELTLGDVMNLPYPDNSMDGIFHVNCFYFWEDLHQGCREMYRVLAPGGVVVTTMDRTSVDRAVERGFLTYAHNTDPGEYIKALEMAGFVGFKEEVFLKGEEQCYGYIARKEGGKNTPGKEP